MKKRLLGYYNYTVILTYAGMLMAFAGTLLAIAARYWDAVICLMIAGVCDMFDGAVASTKERDVSEKRFGIQIDSLSDLVSFGVMPAVFTYMITDCHPAAAVAAGLYVLAALIRLAYFNVLEEERQSQTTEKRTSYLGVPVTTIAVLLPAVFLLYDEKLIKSTRSFVVLILVVAIGFILPVSIRKPKLIGKICLIFVGLLEMLGMIFLMGWGAT